jgi:hypothetical protein
VPARPSLPRTWRARGRLLLAGLLTCATVAALLPSAHGATSSVNVSLNVLSATTLDPSGCASNTPNITSFGTIQPDTPYATTQDCAVIFGSANDSSMLRLYQQDGGGGALVPGPTSGVVGWWSMNGNGNDQAPSPTNLTFTGGSFTATGPTGYDQARTNAAGNRAVAAYKPAYDLADFTIDMWFRGTPSAGYHYLLAKRANATDINYAIWYDESQTSINVSVLASGALRYTNGINSNTVLNGAWHHIAAVSSGVNLSLYLDGQLVDTRAHPGTVTTNTSPVGIGIGADPGGTWTFPGDIDEVRIQSVPRSAAEIATYYQSALPNYQTGSTDFASILGTFGACLHSIGAGVTATWNVNATCGTTSGNWWNPVVATSGTVGAKVAEAASAGVGYTAGLRFGVRTPPNYKPGSYVAPVVLEVLAPTA